MSTDKWATSKSTQLSTKNLGQTAPSAWRCPKTQFWGHLTSWKFEPSPIARPHTHSDSTINKHTEQVKKKTTYWLSWHALNKFKTTPTKTGWSWAQFQKGQPTPCKTICMLFPAHLWVREFWPQIYSLSQALDWGLLSKILASMKMGGA